MRQTLKRLTHTRNCAVPDSRVQTLSSAMRIEVSLCNFSVHVLVSHFCSADHVKSIRLNKSQCDCGLKLQEESLNAFIKIVDHIRLVQYTQLTTS